MHLRKITLYLSYFRYNHCKYWGITDDFNTKTFLQFFTRIKINTNTSCFLRMKTIPSASFLQAAIHTSSFVWVCVFLDHSFGVEREKGVFYNIKGWQEENIPVWLRVEQVQHGVNICWGFKPECTIISYSRVIFY